MSNTQAPDPAHACNCPNIGACDGSCAPYIAPAPVKFDLTEARAIVVDAIRRMRAGHVACADLERSAEEFLHATHAAAKSDELWDQTLQERDRYHEVADSLAQAIAKHLGVEIGEHSSANCPWHRALEALEEAAIQAPEGALRNIAETCEWNAAAPGTDDEKARWARVAAFARAALAAQSGDELQEWSGATPFLRHVQSAAGIDRPDWGDEFLAWYKPGDWLGEHRGAAVWLGQRIGLLNDVAETLRGQLADLQALCDERGRKLYGEDGEAPAEAHGDVLVPLTVLEDASSSLGHYLSDLGWSDEDMQAMDNLDAYIARHKANAAAQAAHSVDKSADLQTRPVDKKVNLQTQGDEPAWTSQPQIVRNLLESCANWLESRSHGLVLHIQPDPEEGGGYASLMREYAKNLRELNAVLTANVQPKGKPVDVLHAALKLPDRGEPITDSRCEYLYWPTGRCDKCGNVHNGKLPGVEPG